MKAYDNTVPASSGKTKWKREDVASAIVDFESAKARMSQRQFARETGIRRTTLQHWLSRKKSLDSSAELVEFFESPWGIAFVHRLVTAARFEFCKNGPASIHSVVKFLRRCGLDAFVAASYGTQQKVSNDMDKAIVSFGESERARMAENMPYKLITLCEDETFHPDICLVAIEAASNFIILEEYADSRDGATWNDVAAKALEGLNVKVVQVAGDEAKGIRNHTEKGLGARHSPDLFHVSQEIGRGVSGPLAGEIKKAEKRLEEASKETLSQTGKRDEYDNLPKRPPGRRPDFGKRVAEAAETEEKAKAGLDSARENLEVAQRARREIGQCYHPYDPETGEKQGPDKVSELLESKFETISGTVSGVSERGQKHVEKAHRVVADMVAAIAFFFVMVRQYTMNMDLTELELAAVNDFLIPGFYLRRAARNEKDETRRAAIFEKSEELLSILGERDGPFSGICEDRTEELAKAARECADFFQRSSSCVEGRNAQLSLRHHGIHRLSENRLKALTVVHNFHVKRPDGTTPAQRFFQAEHGNPFEWLVDNMDYPARPRKRFDRAA
jgi:hypothetical protein